MADACNRQRGSHQKSFAASPYVRFRAMRPRVGTTDFGRISEEPPTTRTGHQRMSTGSPKRIRSSLAVSDAAIAKGSRDAPVS